MIDLNNHPCTAEGMVNPDTSVVTLACISPILTNLLFWLFALVGIAAVILVIYAGVRFILSGGDAKQIEGARKIITYALIGLAVVLLSFVVLNLISVITGVSCINGLSLGACR